MVLNEPWDPPRDSRRGWWALLAMTVVMAFLGVDSFRYWIRRRSAADAQFDWSNWFWPAALFVGESLLLLIAFVLTFRKKPTPRWLLWLVLTCAAVNFVIMVAALGFPAI